MLSCLFKVNNAHVNQLLPPLNHSCIFCFQPYGRYLSREFGNGQKMNERQIFRFVHGGLPLVVFATKQSRTDIYSLHFIVKKKFRWHHIIVGLLLAPKIISLYCLNRWCNILDTVRKIEMMMRMKVDSNKVICPDLGRSFGCIDDHDDLQLIDPYKNLMLRQLQDMNACFLVLI